MGIFQNIVNKYKDVKEKIDNKNEFKKALLQAVNDGKLTGDEIDLLDKQKEELGLTDEDLKGIRLEIFTLAFNNAKEDQRVTKEEGQELEKIQKYLGLADNEIENSKKELARLRLLNEIQQGNIPTTVVVNLVTQKDEKIYWSENAILLEEKVIKRKYEGGSRGVSFRIMKGVSYRMGAHQGQITSETGIIPVSSGQFIITNKRVIFRGDSISFAVNLNKILNVRLFNDGLQFFENNRSKPRLVKFLKKENQDIIGAIISYAINHFQL